MDLKKPLAFTPINVSAWIPYLANYPYQSFIERFVDGHLHGFDIGSQRQPVHQRCQNHVKKWDTLYPIVVRSIQKEVEAGRIIGPFLTPPIQTTCSPLGLVEKKYTVPLEHRLILNLSHPQEDSVNDSIRTEDAACSMLTFDNAVERICLLTDSTTALFLCSS